MLIKAGTRLVRIAALAASGAFLWAAPAAAAQLTYQGGPVMTSVKTVLVVWGSQVDSSLQSADTGLLSDLAAASGTTGNEFAMLPQYSVTGQTLEYRQTFGGAYTIAPGTCPGATTACSVQDSDIQAELESQIASGHLPPPTGNGLTTGYLVLFPRNDNIYAGGSESGAQFCEYHSSVVSGGAHIIYGVLPDNLNLWSSGCGSNASPTNNEVSSLTHVLAEMITDPLVGESNVAWYDNANGEIGDICNAKQATNTINGHTYVVQELWSNADAACVSSNTLYNAPTAAYTTSVSASTVTLKASASSTNGSILSYAWKFGDGSSGSGQTVAHSYSAAGTYTVTLTVTDSLGFIDQVSHQVTISSQAPGPPPAVPEIIAAGRTSTAIRGRTVLVTVGQAVRCPAALPPLVATPCRVAVNASSRRRIAGTRRAETIKIARATFTVPAGTTRQVKFKLDRQGRRLLLKFHRLRAKVRILVRYETLAPITAARTYILHKPARRR